MVANKDENSWEPSSLIEMQDDNNIGRLIWVQKTCHLSDGEYQVAISAAPENYNIQGRCGAAISAQVKVSFQQATFFEKTFDQSCSYPDDPAYRRFVIHAKTHQVTLSTQGSG